MQNITRHIYKYRYPIAGTLIFHLILLLLLSWLTVDQRRLQRPESLIAVEFEKTEEEQPEEKPEEKETEQTPAESRTDRAASESAPGDVQEAGQNRFDEPRSNAKEAVDKQIEDELKELEEQVIQEQRDAGYGYTQEEAEALINSKKLDEVKDVEEKEAESEGAVKGPTNISYKLENRYDRYIYVPVYLCRNRGEVTVNIAVDRNGNVVAAKVDKESTRTDDHCLLNAGVKAAESTRFNRDENASEIQKGSITFRFSAQD